MPSPHVPQIIDRAKAWVQSNLPFFKLPHPATDKVLIRSIKALGELGQAASLLLRLDPSDQVARGWLEFGWIELRNGALLTQILQRFPQVVALGMVYPPYHRHGLQSEPLIDAFAQAAQKMRPEAEDPQRFPIAMALRALSREAPWDLEKLCKLTLLARQPVPWSLTPARAYELTHEVFYLTGCGQHPEGLNVAQKDYLARCLPSWLSGSSTAGMFDLLAEIIMVQHCFPGPCISAEIWEVLHIAQAPDGLIPFSSKTSSAGTKLAATSSAGTAPAASYHSTLATLMAAAMCRICHF